MNKKQLKLGAMLLLGIGLTGLQAQPAQKFTDPKCDYLGQPLPGETPVVFAPGIVSTANTIEHGSPTFSPDGNEVFWQTNRFVNGEKTRSIFGMSMRRVGGKWTVPEISSYDSSPFFSPDGNRLYFLPIGPEKGETNGPYFVEKKGNGWSEPKCLGLIARFPELRFVYCHSLTRNGTLYFLGYLEGVRGNFGIYRSELVNGEYVKPELLPPSINAPGGNTINWTPFIAPDESYLLFSSNRCNPDTDAGDLYACFRQLDGSWTDAVSLSATINSSQQERFPAVSPDGKYLFFTRWVSDDNEDVFWVSAEIIGELKAKVIQEKLLKKPSKAAGGKYGVTPEDKIGRT